MIAFVAATLCTAAVALAGDPAPLPVGAPAATVDLTTADGAATLGARWRVHDVRIVDAPFRAPDGDGKPNGSPLSTFDIEPKAGAAAFDDSDWEIVDPSTLGRRRGGGRLSFVWYRVDLTVPESIGGVTTESGTLVLRLTVDDYAEVWVDGVLPRSVGEDNRNLVAGWNRPNRLVVGSGVHPGQRIQLAVLGANGPFSDPPPNYVWVRDARIELYPTPRAVAPEAVPTMMRRLDPAVDEVVPPDARIERVAAGLTFAEGPVWVDDDRGGSLLFSDPNRNVIHRWRPDGTLTVERERSGYAGEDILRYRQPGSNGLALDAAGRLTICEHGNRCVSRIEPDGSRTVIAERFDGRRLNSPNDLVYAKDGSLYFTDPPFGLPGFEGDPSKELPDAPVFLLRDGRLAVVSSDLRGPNGIALSPDERFLYVANWDEGRKIVMRYRRAADGTLSDGTVFADMTGEPGEEALDGIEVDRLGRLFVSGPGGLWIIGPDGRRLGVLAGPELAANVAWGDRDRRTLYMAARSGLYRIRLPVGGAEP